MRSLAVLLALAAAGWAQQRPPDTTAADEPARPPRLKRGTPKAGDARGEAAPESKPQELPADRVIITDADGRVIQTLGGGGKPAGPAPVAPDPEQPGERAHAYPSSGDPVIDKAREVIDQLQVTLPNYLCDQITYRHQGEGRPRPDWRMRDRVTAEIMFVDGKETYRNLKVNGKLLKKGSPMDSGTWSSGDWATVQLDVLAPNTNADFRYQQESILIAGRKAKKYTYSVKQPNSHWRVEFNGYRIFPAYRGSLWIDAETHRLLRVEMEAREIPSDYPFDIVEMTVENGFVRIGAQEYLMPVKAENLACQRGTVTCVRNENEFRNYRKFTAESTISTTDSSVKFEGEEDTPQQAQPPAAAPPDKKSGRPKR